MVLFLFFCSGATALVYEVVWSKYLSLMFGSTIYAQTIVLAVFMGGLAVGNRLIGARSDVLKHPLVAYGILEVVIGFYAFYFSSIYLQADRLFVAVGSHLIQHGAWLFLAKAVVSVGLLLLPTVLMGGTLPLLSAWLQQQSQDPGRSSARFYSVNSLGAVCGSWLAGFFLIRSLGIDSTLEMTAGVNLLVGFTAIAVSRLRSRVPQAAESVAAKEKLEKSYAPEPVRWLGILVATTGGISMGLEILASRSLSLIFGASVQAFAVVLMAFILGIGLGSAAVASPRLKAWRNETLLLLLLLLAAAIIGGLVLGIEQWVVAYRHLRTGLARTPMGYRFYQIMAGGFSMILLGFPSALIGAVLPISIRLSAGKAFGDRVGRLLTWNTLGAVVGVLLTGFVLMPNLGLRNSFNFLAVALCIPALLLAWSGRKPVLIAGTSLAILGLAASSCFGGQSWRYVLSAGAFRFHETEVTAKPIELRKKSTKILFYEDGPDATVSVEQGDGITIPADVSLRISGKPEASNRLDMGTQLLVAHLPMLARPGATDVFVVGLASGITCGGILAYPIEHLVVGENCEPVLQAVKLFSPWNRGVITNRATEIVLEDARTVLKLSPRKYDVIINQPSNPWFASVGSVFSQEFFQTAANRLKPGGIMAQWFHVYEMNDGIVELVIRTFLTVFRVIEIWDAGGGDIILLGSDRPWDASLASFRRSYQLPLVRQDLASIGLPTPEALLGHQLASQRTAFAVTGPGPIQSDAFPILEYDAPIAFFIGTTATRLTRFDERTWQFQLAPEEKRTALLSLDDESLRGVFKYETINTELMYAVGPRLLGTSSKEKSVTSQSSATMPCLLQPASMTAGEIVPQDASDQLKPLFRAAAALRQPGENWGEWVRQIRDSLEVQLLSSRETQPVYAVRLVIIAARSCLAHRDYQLAKELLELGLRYDPESPELAYLQRIFDRETAVSPTKAEFSP